MISLFHQSPSLHFAKRAGEKDITLFGVTNDNTDMLSEMLDITNFEGQCRFVDCQHINEKGCALIRAVDDRIVDSGVYENYLELRKEAWHYTASVHEKSNMKDRFQKR